MWVTRVGIKPGALRFGQNDLPQKPPAKEGEYLGKDEPDPKPRHSAGRAQNTGESFVKGLDEMVRSLHEDLLNRQKVADEKLKAEAAEQARWQKVQQNLEKTHDLWEPPQVKEVPRSTPQRSVLGDALKSGLFVTAAMAFLGLFPGGQPLLLAAPLGGVAAVGLKLLVAIFV